MRRLLFRLREVQAAQRVRRLLQHQIRNRTRRWWPAARPRSRASRPRPSSARRARLRVADDRDAPAVDVLAVAAGYFTTARANRRRSQSSVTALGPAAALADAALVVAQRRGSRRRRERPQADRRSGCRRRVSSRSRRARGPPRSDDRRQALAGRAGLRHRAGQRKAVRGNPHRFVVRSGDDDLPRRDRGDVRRARRRAPCAGTLSRSSRPFSSAQTLSSTGGVAALTGHVRALRVDHGATVLNLLGGRRRADLDGEATAASWYAGSVAPTAAVRSCAASASYRRVRSGSAGTIAAGSIVSVFVRALARRRVMSVVAVVRLTVVMTRWNSPRTVASMVSSMRLPVGRVARPRLLARPRRTARPIRPLLDDRPALQRCATTAICSMPIGVPRRKIMKLDAPRLDGRRLRATGAPTTVPPAASDSEPARIK